MPQQVPKARQDSIRAYAAEMAGTQIDLDSDLESATIELLVKTAPRTVPPRLQPIPGCRSVR